MKNKINVRLALVSIHSQEIPLAMRAPGNLIKNRSRRMSSGSFDEDFDEIHGHALSLSCMYQRKICFSLRSQRLMVKWCQRMRVVCNTFPVLIMSMH